MFAANDLEAGMDKIESLFGVRPVPGGQHEGFGTHNALLSLGEKLYLEVIAPDPSLEPPGRRHLPNFLDPNPHLVTWIMRTDAIEALAQKLRDAGIPIGEVFPGKRVTPEGRIIEWKLTNPFALPFDGAIPFLINWGSSPHPADEAPIGGSLVGLRIKHPDPNTVLNALKVLDVELEVQQATKFKLVASVETKNGLVELS